MLEIGHQCYPHISLQRMGLLCLSGHRIPHLPYPIVEIRASYDLERSLGTAEVIWKLQIL